MMASQPIPHPRYTPPMPAVTRILSRFDRPQIEGFIAVAIELLDTFDGDSDSEPITVPEDLRAEFDNTVPDEIEANGDELDGNPAEDDFWPHAEPLDGSAGCVFSDGNEIEDDCCEAGDDGCAPKWLHGQTHWGAHADEEYAKPAIADATAYHEQKARIQRDRTYRVRQRCLIDGRISYEPTSTRRLFIEPTTPTKRQLLTRKRGVPRSPRA
jgi:hypothetical protein